MKRYRIGNWSEYNTALINRGSLTVWIEEGALEKWQAKKEQGRPGKPPVYSDEAILMLLVLREVFHLPFRALQGFAQSIFLLMKVALQVPSYSQISRRAQKLNRKLLKLNKKRVVNLIFDSSGLKVHGEGEWKVRVHGKGKRRSWKKIHIGLDADTQEIILCELTDKEEGDAQVAEQLLEELNGKLGEVYGDGAYDSKSFRRAVHERGGRAIVPPPRHAIHKGKQDDWERERDSSIAEIVGLGGDNIARRLWKKLTGYHRRSLGETLFFRLKQLFGGHLKARSPGGQASEVYCKSMILNTMVNLGFPQGYWVEVPA